MASFFDNWYAQQQQQQPQQGAPQGGGMWTITGPNGETYQVPAEQMGGAGFTPPNQQGMNAGPLPGAAGAAAGYNLGNNMFGASPPASPEIVGAGSSAGALPSFNMGYGPEQYLTDSYQLPGSIGSGAPAYTAEQVASVGSQGIIPPGVGAIAAPIGVGALGAATAYTAYDANKNAQNSSKNPITGLKEGIKSAGPLNYVPLLGQAAWISGALGAQFGSGKDKDQTGRDAVKKKLVETGFLNPDFTLTLPDGNTFDFGKDGNARLPSEGVDPITGKDWRHYYDVDWSKENAGGIVAAVNPLAAAFAGGNDKLTKDFAGYLTNAAMAGGDPMENIMSFIQKAGLDHDKLYGLIHTMAKSQGGKLDDAKADAFKNGLDQLYGVGAYKGKGQQFGTSDIKPGQKPGQQVQPQPQPPQQQNKPTYTPKPSVQSSPGVTGQPGPVQKPVPKPGGSPFVSSPLNKPRGFYGPPPGMRMR